MPRDIPTYVRCAEPGVARSHRQIGGMTGFLVFIWLRSPAITLASFLLVLVGLVLASSPAGWGVLSLVIITALAEFKYWYYNERLLCVRDRDCAVGTVISPPTPSFDGDRKLNLMLAPHGQRTFVETLLDHLEINEAMLRNNANFNDPPFHTSAPFLDTIGNLRNDFDKLRDYMKALRSENPDNSDAESNMFRQIRVGLMDRLMADPTKNFYNRFNRKDANHIALNSALWNAIPEDFDPAVNWQAADARSTRTHPNPYETVTNETLNPMYRFDNDHLVGYFHCEIDGYALGLLLDNLTLAFIAFMLAMLALWAIMGPLAPLGALIIAAFLFFLKWFIDEATGNDGDAEDPDVDWDDPDVPGEGEAELKGDVVVVYGNWIMDTEHNQYFEIHPVRAFYIIARNSLGQEPVLVNGNLEQEEFGHENFDPTLITAERADAICNIITNGEEGTSDDVILRTGPTALSYGMTTHYAGAQQQIR